MGEPYKGFNITVRLQNDPVFPTVATATWLDDPFAPDPPKAEGFTEEHAIENIKRQIDRLVRPSSFGIKACPEQ